MENLALNIVNEVVETEAFIVDNDTKAEWAINKIREEKAELRRIEIVCESMIAQYQEKMRIMQDKFEQKTGNLRNQLMQYFETITPKTTKTQATYKLPSGTLKKKFGGVEYIRDEIKLLEFVKRNGGADDFINVKETVKWAELKKGLTQKDNILITEDGEIVEGVTLQQKPDTFEVEV